MLDCVLVLDRAMISIVSVLLVTGEKAGSRSALLIPGLTSFLGITWRPVLAWAVRDSPGSCGSHSWSSRHRPDNVEHLAKSSSTLTHDRHIDPGEQNPS
jgi:hypothetical protein